VRIRCGKYLEASSPPNPLSKGEGVIYNNCSPSSFGGRGWGMEDGSDCSFYNFIL